jgi:hypothetical protein
MNIAFDWLQLFIQIRTIEAESQYWCLRRKPIGLIAAAPTIELIHN